MLPRHPLRDPLLSRLDEHLRRDLAVPAGARLHIAFSGGLDSTALLAALAALAPVRGYEVQALHVHHGLQDEADDWVAAASRMGASLGVALQVRYWEGAPAAGESEEASARRGRYRLLEGEVSPGDWLMTAHQADDQAETVVLFLTRGAGLDGLAGIERCRPCGAGWLARPLLPFRRAELAAFVERCGLSPVNDPANRDRRFTRVRIREQALPCLREAFGGHVSPAVARSADLLQDAREVLEDKVARRLDELGRPGPPPVLDASGLAGLGPAEGRFVLREALRRAGQVLPERDQLERARRLAARTEASGRVTWSGGGVQRRGRDLVLQPGEGAR